MSVTWSQKFDQGLFVPENTDAIPFLSDPGGTPAVKMASVADVIGLRRDVITLTNAQIKALPTTGTLALLTPASSAELIKVLDITVTLSPWVADYTNIDGAASLIIGIDDGATYKTEELLSDGLLSFGEASFFVAGLPAIFYGTENVVGLSEIVGLPINLICDNNGAGDFTGGDASTVLTIQILSYRQTLAI